MSKIAHMERTYFKSQQEWEYFLNEVVGIDYEQIESMVKLGLDSVDFAVMTSSLRFS